VCFNILVGRFYDTNNAATNIIDHNGFDAILHTLLTNVALLSCAVAVTLLPNVKVPFVLFEGG
jgi:hypothetical protein